MKNKKVQEELEKMAPFLTEYKKGTPQKMPIPTNYFERFEDRLMHRIQEEEALEKGTNSTGDRLLGGLGIKSFLKQLFRPYYALGGLASMLIIIAGCYWFLTNTTHQETWTEGDMDGLLADGSIDFYIDSNIDNFTTEDIVAILESEELEQMEAELIAVDDEKTNRAERSLSTMDKALEELGEEDWLDELNEEDLELGVEEDLF